MYVFRYVFVLAMLLTTSHVFADTVDMSMNPNDKACANIAKACVAGGFNRQDYPTKRFWQDCMKPVLMNQEVVDITIDPKVAAACRAVKIDELKAELSDLQNAVKAPN